MSSVSRRPNGHRWLSYRFGGKRHTLRLGTISERDARDIQRRLDQLIGYRHIGAAPDPEMVAWLTRLGSRLHANLVTAGLVADRGPQTVEELCQAHEQKLTNAGRKPSTLHNSRVLYANLRSYFGATRRIDAITIPEADGFRRWLAEHGHRNGGQLARATVNNRVRRARGVYRMAVVNGWLSANPFREPGSCNETNPERNAYISMQLFERILAGTADLEFRLLLALVRIMGPRCPSEIHGLKWGDIDDAANLLTVRSPKTEHNAGQDRRQVPIFAEVSPYLEAWRDASGGKGLMFPRFQVTGQTIVGKLEALCRKAEEPLWPKPMVNLRASAEHDMFSAGHPIDQVARWLGHSPETALRHYTRIAKEQSSKAVALRLIPGGPKRSQMRSAVALRGGELRGVYEEKIS